MAAGLGRQAALAAARLWFACSHQGRVPG
jgi:hypothetical protein